MNIPPQMQPPNPPQGMNFVERSSMANQQKSVSESLAKSIGNRLDNVARFVQSTSDTSKDSNKTLKSMDSTLDTMHKENTKALQSIRDLLKSKNIADNASNKISSLSPKKDFFAKKQDTTMQKSLSDIDDVLRAMRKDQKDQYDEAERKKKAGDLGKGLMGGLGKFLAIGGLLGFVLTGKVEFLGDMIKSVKGLKVFGDVFSGMLKLGTGAGKVASTLGGAAKMAKAGEDAVKTAKTFGTVFHSIGTVFSGVGKTAKVGGFAAKIGGKLGMKALKLIPGVGAVMGIVMAIERFSKGDVVGGLGELASGVAGLFPGVGTVLSMGIDTALLLKDYANIKTPNKGGVLEGIGSFFSGNKPSMDNSGDAINPPSGTPSGQGDSNLMMAMDKKPITPSKISYDRINLAPATKKPPSIFSKVKSGIKNAVGEVKRTASIAMNQAKENGIGSGVGAVVNRATAGKDAYYLAGIQNDSISGIKPGVWKNFLGMAKDFKSNYGIPLPITSGWRSQDKQKQLYEADLAQHGGVPSGTVAKPGRSMHEFGYAMDIGGRTQGTFYKDKLTEAIDPATGKNLLETWGFWNPMDGKRTSVKEDWHIEPKSIAPLYDQVRAGKITDFNAEVGEHQAPVAPPSGTPSGVGDSNMLDLKSDVFSPTGGRKIQMGAKNAPMSVTLSRDDINALAAAIGEQYKNAIPKQTPGKTMGGKSASARI